MARTLTHGSTFLAFLFKSEAIYEYEPEEESYIKINATQSSKRRIFGLVGMKIEELVCNI